MDYMGNLIQNTTKREEEKVFRDISLNTNRQTRTGLAGNTATS